MGRIAAALVALTVPATLFGCGAEPVRIPSTLTTTPAGPIPDAPATTAPAAPAARCSQAPRKLVELIDQAFTGGETLDNAQSVDGPDATTYVGGNILRGNELVSSADVWLLSGGQLYALSSGARRASMLPDGRDLGSAGDDYGSAVQDCVA